MNSDFPRILRLAFHLIRVVASTFRKASLKARYPGLVLTEPVQISGGCDIQVAPGARMLLDSCFVDRGVTLIAGVGARVIIRADFIGKHSTIVARDSIAIGDGSKLAENVVIRDGNHDHSVDLRAMKFTQSPIVLGRDVWLCASSIVLAGVTIGDHSTVAAGAVVTKDVPARATVVGIPARVLTS